MVTPCFSMYFIKRGKPSWGELRPKGYQLKCPIPSDAKRSPSFQLVRPLILPPHSLYQIFTPILRAISSLISIRGAAKTGLIPNRVISNSSDGVIQNSILDFLEFLSLLLTLFFL